MTTLTRSSTRPIISYQRLAEAIAYYKELGYQYIEVPWWVTEDITRVTLPEPLQPIRVGDTDQEFDFIGSAEQGFIDLFNTASLRANTLYVSCSPCIRREQEDALHQQSFMKVELFAFIENEGEHSYDQARQYVTILKNHAKEFMSKYHAVGEANLGYDTIDLFVNDIEVGSYGIRNEVDDWYLIYGTGLAEPRFETALGYKRTVNDIIRGLKNAPSKDQYKFTLNKVNIQESGLVAEYSAEFYSSAIGTIANYTGKTQVTVFISITQPTTLNNNVSIDDMSWDNLIGMKVVNSKGAVIFTHGETNEQI